MKNKSIEITLEEFRKNPSFYLELANDPPIIIKHADGRVFMTIGSLVDLSKYVV